MRGAKQTEMLENFEKKGDSSSQVRLSVCLPYVGPSVFLGFKILNFNIFGVFQKTEYFLGYENFVDIFLGSPQNWTIF